jgi:hypothetical protein
MLIPYGARYSDDDAERINARRSSDSEVAVLPTQSQPVHRRPHF